MMLNQVLISEARAAKNRLWKTIPVGSGKDFNTLLKYIEALEQYVNSGDLTL